MCLCVCLCVCVCVCVCVFVCACVSVCFRPHYSRFRQQQQERKKCGDLRRESVTCLSIWSGATLLLLLWVPMPKLSNISTLSSTECIRNFVKVVTWLFLGHFWTTFNVSASITLALARTWNENTKAYLCLFKSLIHTVPFVFVTFFKNICV